MEIFAQEFEPANYFCDWTCIHLGKGQLISKCPLGAIVSTKKPMKIFFKDFGPSL